mmetsp:Transcript_44736/g.43333  ORF Transcript_44736/g.43333 Transcript_44736/m.43333 type:complete len:232 (-) Transcript_44736:26-721(-)
MVKVINNLGMSSSRNIWRHLFFDNIRAQFVGIAYAYLFDYSLDLFSVGLMVVFTSICSVVANTYMRDEFFDDYPLLKPYLNLEYLLMFSWSLINTLNLMELNTEGELVRASIMIFLEVQANLFIYWFEDMAARDLNVLGGLIHNWDFYEFYIYSFPLLFLLQYLHHSIFLRSEALDGWRLPFLWKLVGMKDEYDLVQHYILNTLFAAIIYKSYYKSLKLLDDQNCGKIKKD